jgi:hypothetical protein
MTTPTLRPSQRVAAWAAALAALAVVFAAYLQPSMARQVADFVWFCAGR